MTKLRGLRTRRPGLFEQFAVVILGAQAVQIYAWGNIIGWGFWRLWIPEVVMFITAATGVLLFGFCLWTVTNVEGL